MMKHFSFFVLVLLSGVVSAQRGKQLIPIYIEGTAYKPSGWLIAPGITFMLPEDRRENLTGYTAEENGGDTLYSGDFARKGKIGAYIEAGRHRFISDRILLDHIDYGVHFKMLRGTENFSGITNVGSAFVPVDNKARFSESFVGAFFNASNILQFKDRFWVQNSLGVNADFRIISRRVVEGPLYGAAWNFPPTFLAQVHYKLGIGWKPEPGIFIMPMIETHILTAFPWDNGKSTLQYFVGRDRPFILTIRIEWLDKATSRRCENQPGKGPDGVSKDKTGKHDGNDLWGPDGKKMKKRRK